MHTDSFRTQLGNGHIWPWIRPCEWSHTGVSSTYFKVHRFIINLIIIYFCCQASTIEKPVYLRPQFSSAKAIKQQKETMKPRSFQFTAEDLYNYLHHKNGNVETINLEESKSKKMEENGAGIENQSSCKLRFVHEMFIYLFVCVIYRGLTI